MAKGVAVVAGKVLSIDDRGGFKEPDRAISFLSSKTSVSLEHLILKAHIHEGLLL